MPPQLSDDEDSDHSEGLGAPIRQESVTSAESKKNDTRSFKVEQAENEDAAIKTDNDEDEDEDDEDEEMGEDEYVVEKIISHIIDDETGDLSYEVKWEGYDKKSDRTWEPEENLETAKEILTAYLATIGGKDAVIEAWKEKKSKKRSRNSVGNGTGPGAKKGRKSHPASSTPPVSVKVDFKPPTGSWEDEVTGIDACEGTKGDVVVYLTWKGNHKTQHPLSQVYKRCPQRMLKFYESHLIFKKTELPEGQDDDS